MSNASWFKWFMAAVLCAVLSGCSSRPKVEKPDTVAPPPPEEAATEVTAPTLPPPPTGEPLPGAKQ